MQKPDAETLMQWLEQADVPYYLCGECSGLHLPALQEREGVLESRLFVEDFGLALVTELDLRATALLPASADVGPLNMEFPLLKVFPDVLDGELPRLVAEGVLPTGAGVSPEQVRHFLAEVMRQTGTLVDVCTQREYLTGTVPEPGASLH